MRLTLNQMSALDELWTKTDLSDADDPALELDAVNFSDEFPTGSLLVCLRRTGEQRNLTLGTIKPNGEIVTPEPATPPKEVKAKRLRVGYRVWAEGAPQPSRISKISREHPDHPGEVVAWVEWGRIVYDPDVLVNVEAEILHPRIVDDKNVEIGIGSMIAGGDDPDGEVVGIIEPDESPWGIRVQWPEFDQPETFWAPATDPSEDPLTCNDVEAI